MGNVERTWEEFDQVIDWTYIVAPDFGKAVYICDSSIVGGGNCWGVVLTMEIIVEEAALYITGPQRFRNVSIGTHRRNSPSQRLSLCSRPSVSITASLVLSRAKLDMARHLVESLMTSTTHSLPTSKR